MVLRALVLLLLTIPVLGQVMYRGDAAHSAVYHATVGQAFAGIQWRFQTDGDVISSPAVAGSTIYFGSGDGHLYAVDRQTGTQQWRFDAGSPVASSPAVAHGAVFFTARDGRMFAVDAKTGARRWSLDGGKDLPLPWGFESGDHYIASPVLDGPNVLFAGGDGVVRLADAATGRIVWQRALNERLRATPAIAGGRVFAASIHGRIFGIDAKDGRVVWTFATEGVGIDSSKFGFDRHTIQSSPSVAGGLVLAGARDGKLYAVDAATGKERWTASHGTSWVITSPAAADGVVYAGSSDAAFVQALQLSDGKELWRTAIESPVWSSIAVAGDMLLFGDFLGRIHALDRKTGAKRWFFRTGSPVFSSPVVDGNLIFVGSGDGALYALRSGDVPIKRASYIKREGDLPQILKNRGYEALDDAQLTAFLRERIADRARSVIVFAAAEPQGPGAKVLLVPGVFTGEKPLLRTYLESGGKVVWVGPPPAIWKENPQSLMDLDFSAPGRMTGVDHRRAIFDPRGTRATPAGRRFALATRFRDDWGVPTDEVTEVLALDDWGFATSWWKHYGGPRGSGFVKLPPDNTLAIYLAAEWWPE